MVLTQFWRLAAARVWKCDSNPASATYISQIPLSHLGSQTNPPISSFCGLLRHNLCFPWKRRTVQPKVFMTHLNNGKMQGETKWQIEICQCSLDQPIKWDNTVHKKMLLTARASPIYLCPLKEIAKKDALSEWWSYIALRPHFIIAWLYESCDKLNWTILYCFGVTRNWDQLMTNGFGERKLQQMTVCLLDLC